AAPLPAQAQVVVVDEGTFSISRGGSRIGRESFTIRRSPGPGGDVYVANATVDFDAQRLSPALRADNSFSPLAYQLEVRSGGTVQEQLRASWDAAASARRCARPRANPPRSTSSPMARSFWTMMSFTSTTLSPSAPRKWAPPVARFPL